MLILFRAKDKVHEGGSKTGMGQAVGHRQLSRQGDRLPGGTQNYDVRLSPASLVWVSGLSLQLFPQSLTFSPRVWSMAGHGDQYREIIF